MDREFRRPPLRDILRLFCSAEIADLGGYIEKFLELVNKISDRGESRQQHFEKFIGSDSERLGRLIRPPGRSPSLIPLWVQWRCLFQVFSGK